ncbi:MAG: methyltransferase domain-containing protein, partial [Desulfitobacteriaceae bacterium]
MTVYKAQVLKNFGQNAVTYDQYAVVQKEMAKELFGKIIKMECCFQNILEIGCGTGFLTELLAREYPNAQIITTDIAPEMIAIASKKLTAYANIQYFVADGENLSTVDQVSFGKLPFDLIVSNVVFQWFVEYAAAFTQYHSYLEPGGYLIFSTLGVGTFKELYCCLKDAQNGNPTLKLANVAHKLADPGNLEKREPFIEKKYLQMIMINSG